MSDEEIDEFAQNILRRAKLRNQVLNPESSAPSMATGLDAIRKRTVPDEPAEAVKHLPVLSDESAHTRKPQNDEKIKLDESLKVTEDDEDELDGDEAESSSSEENKNPTPVPMSLGSRRTFRRLGELYGEEGSMPSPVRDHTIGEKTPDPTPQHLCSDKSGGRRGRLHALASTINGWEDDLSHYCSPTSRFNVSPPRQARKSNAALGIGLGGRTPPFKPNFTTPEPACGGREAQGFVSNISKTKLTFEYSDNTDSKGSPLRARSISPTKHVSLFEKHMAGVSSSPIEKRSASTSPIRKPSGSPVRNMPISSTPISKASSPVRSPPKTYTAPVVADTSTPKAKLSVAQKTAMFEVKGPLSNVSFVGKQKDPAEMTVAERARLFEQQALQSGSNSNNGVNRNFGSNKRAFGKPFPNPNRSSPVSPKKSATQVCLPKGTVENQRRLFENALCRADESPEEAEPEAKKVAFTQPRQLSVVHVETPPPMFVPPAPPIAISAPPPPPLPVNLSVTFSALASQMDSPPERSRSRSPQKQNQTSTTPKRSASPSPPRFHSPKAKYPGLRNVKRIRVNEPKAGRMYPSLTDIESTETETESEMNPHEENQFDLDYNDDEDDMDSETSHVSGFSLGTHIERVAKQNIPAPKRNPRYRPTEDFSTSLACRQIDELIDDALEGQSFSMDTIMEAELNAPASSTPIACSTGGVSMKDNHSWQVSDELARLNSFDKAAEPNDVDLNGSSSSGSQLTVIEENLVNEEYEGPETNIDAILDNSVVIQEVNEDDAGEACSSFEYTNTSIVGKDASPVVTSSPLYQKKRNPSPATTPLVHTVSFFRKQQGQAIATTPRKAMQDSGAAKLTSPVKSSSNMETVNGIIKKLEEEMAAQHRSIAQVSKALNLCKSTVEFSESTENVECERILLIASQKRTLILNEIHRLKTEGVLSKLSVLSPTKQDLGPSCRGNMTLTDVEIQLKREFLPKAMSGDTVYHFMCLAKYHSQLEASSLISIGNGVSSSKIQGGVLHFPNSFTMNGLEPEFEVKLEVYVLQTMKEFLPHEAKYHIKKETRKLTPKKQKHESKLSRPFQQSPAGPNAVRTTNFTLCGSLTIDISTLQRNHWELEGIRFSSPLEGSVAIKIQCSAEGGSEERGFLTMFDDVSGFGAWHRRWCKLTMSDLSYWMYPEDEIENKVPMGSIPLRLCVTSRVGPVQREVCARANTFLLVTTRIPQEKDHDTLTTSCHSDYTAIRHLLTADTKEERDLWCKQINKALTNLRAWDPHAHSPNDSLFYK